MQKYITVAALLAAGTVFANAELLWTMNFGSEYTNGYQLITAEGVSYTPNVWDVSGCTNEDGGVVTAGNHRPHLENGDTGVNWADGFVFTIDVELPAIGDISASNSWPVFATLTDGTNNLRFGPYTGDGNSVNVDGSALTKTLTDQFSVENGGRYTFVLTVENYVASLTVNDTLIASGTLDADTYGTASINNIALGGNTGNSYRINSTVYSISMSTIPEPSAFGLLAGVGALALVASRRRRAK